MTTSRTLTDPEVPSKPESSTSAWTPLRHPVFRGLWIAAIASNVGGWMQDVGSAWLMTSLTPSPLFVSLVQAATSLPMFLLALPAGALADIIDRRRLLIFAQVWMLLAAAGLAALTLFGLTSAPLLLIFTCLMGIGSALSAPAWQSIVPELVPPEDLPGAVALHSVAINISRAVGPALGGLVIAMAGPAATFVLNAISFVGVVIVFIRWKREHVPSAFPAERFTAAIRAGARYVVHAGPLRAVLARTIAFMLGASGLWALIPVVARGKMKLGPAGFGLLLGCIGIGAFTAVILLPRARQRLSTDALVGIATAFFAIATVFLAYLRNPFLLAPLLLIGGMGWVTALSSLNVAAQRAVPAWVRARALAVYLLVWFGTVTIGSVIWGALAGRFGTDVALACAAILLPLGLVTSRWFKLTSGEGLDLSPSQHWPTPLLSTTPAPDEGPVMVQIEYHVRENAIADFERAMQTLRSERLRDGAFSWGLYADAADRTKYIETFVVESWLEHLRQHQRVTIADRDAQERVKAYLVDGTSPAVTHLIHVGRTSGAAIRPLDAVRH